MTARTDTARLLALIPYLRSHPGVAVTEVARVFGVSTDRVIADLKILWMVGLPGGMPDDLIDIDMDAVDSDGTITITNADALPRPMRLTPDEAWSLLAALQVIADLADDTVRPAVESAVEKLRQVCPQAGPDPVEASLEADYDPRSEWFPGPVLTSGGLRSSIDAVTTLLRIPRSSTRCVSKFATVIATSSDGRWLASSGARGGLTASSLAGELGTPRITDVRPKPSNGSLTSWTR